MLLTLVHIVFLVVCHVHVVLRSFAPFLSFEQGTNMCLKGHMNCESGSVDDISMTLPRD